MTRVGLTQRQSDVLAQIRLGAQRGVTPSYAEIAEAIGLNAKSKNSIGITINRLVERGYLRKLQHKARALELVDGPWDLPAHIDLALAVHCEKVGRRPGEIMAAAVEQYLAKAAA